MTNFVSDRDAAWYADLYRRDGLAGGHVIMLGPGNREPALAALRAFPGGLQIGGGLDETNAMAFLDAGASHVIVTSWLFPEGRLDMDRLRRLSALTGRERLVVDLSCRRVSGGWQVASDRWRTLTDARIGAPLLESLSAYCQEFLIHAADVEGLQKGMDWELAELLAAISPIPTTFAGGSDSLADLDRLELCAAAARGAGAQGAGLDLSIGSALDIFGGAKVRYADCVAWNRRRGQRAPISP